MKTLSEILIDYKDIDITKIVEDEGLLTNVEKKEMNESDKEIKTRFLKMFPDISEEDLILVMKNEKQQNISFYKGKVRDRRPVIMEIKLIHEDLSNEEIWKAYQDTEDEEMAIQKLYDPFYLKELRKRIALENKPVTIVKRKKEEIKEQDIEDEEEEEEEEDEEDKEEEKKKKKKKRNSYARHKLRLDDALAKKDTKEGWSPARIIAFNAITSEGGNLNAYLYRFNQNGETQKNGKWTQEETELFLKRVEEFKLMHGGSIQKWGLFSETIPGRVGYQCANFYRSLIKKGTIKDPDYYIQGGQVKHVFGRGKKRKDGEEKGRRRKKKKSDEDDDNNSEDEEEEEKVKIQSFKSSRHANPLPGFIDQITMQEVEKPTISKYGHVLGYSTWEKILKDSPICPFTNQKLNIYDLTKLTFDNIELYRDQIIQ